MYTHDWFSNNIPHWIQILEAHKGRPNLKYLEIGCYEGKATRWLCDNILTHETSTIDVVDTFAGSMEHVNSVDFTPVERNFRENLADCIELKKVFVNKNTSAKFLRAKQTPQYEMIYIDGSHTAQDVLEDAVLAWPLLATNGIMIFDDYGWNKYPQPYLNPKLAIDSFLSVMESKYTLLHKAYQVAIQKI